MAAVEFLRGFISERLTAAAAEILGVFEQTIVQYEEELDRQRKLLDIILKPEIKLHRIDLPQQQSCQVEDVLADQQLCNQRNSILDQEEPEPPQVKEEQQEVCISHEGEQHVLKEETDPSLVTAAYDGPEPNYDMVLSHKATQVLLQQHDCKEEEILQLCNQKRNCSLDWEVPEPTRIKEEHQVLCSSDEGEQHEDTDPFVVTADESNHIKPDVVLSRNSAPGQKCLKCKFCGKSFKCQWNLNTHQRTHTGEKPFSCKTCGKCFSQSIHLTAHMRTHTGEKPFSCKICRKGFSRNTHLTIHLRTHTGDKPYSCKTCGKCFSQKSGLNIHMRTHTGDKPYSCKTCGKCFSHNSAFNIHIRTHKDEKPYSCKTCGKCFLHSSALTVHMRTHTGEKPFSCKTCGKRFSHNSALTVHMRTHTGEKPFSCKTCGKHFSSSCDVSRHMKTHKDVSQAGDPSEPSV